MPGTRSLLVLSVALASALAANGQSPPRRRPPAPARAQAPDPPPPTDRELEAAIRARLADSKIATNHFQVHVQGGVATLEGRTDVMQHKGVATRLAKSMGARQVVNRIEVSEIARQKAAANLTKGRRRAQVTRGETRSERDENR